MMPVNMIALTEKCYESQMNTGNSSCVISGGARLLLLFWPRATSRILDALDMTVIGRSAALTFTATRVSTGPVDQRRHAPIIADAALIGDSQRDCLIERVHFGQSEQACRRVSEQCGRGVEHDFIDQTRRQQ
jgi:hypothetical protein